ncbi:uncharacterized protein LOC115621579 [Scaptodrosophila lebanonensis]|uniref:Uncharacterized protein LOC115621579 n=1 Tax=Drosophila lebanonensis TaxID=7225 RepID=A0A6J2T528_DROLE|nr:uncharacterized protein LOC115621579 [Scaptodrosophila lebanonensis]
MLNHEDPFMHVYSLVVFNMLCEQTERNTLVEIYYLSAPETRNWRKLLALGDTLEQQLKRKLLWVWPTAADLLAFNKLLRLHNIQNILSVGCGSGLLEWLLAAAATEDENPIAFYGLEIDRNWWNSKYALRSFIPLNFVEDAPDGKLDSDFLRHSCCGSQPSALLFCYFNNRQAFLEYLCVYKGKWLIIIGPKPSQGIHTDPDAMHPNFPVDEHWVLHDCLHWTELNIVTFYEKID